MEIPAAGFRVGRMPLSWQDQPGAEEPKEPEKKKPRTGVHWMRRVSLRSSDTAGRLMWPVHRTQGQYQEVRGDVENP